MKGIHNTSSKTYRQLMGNGLRYEIPKFQRDYTWDTEQWDDLWQDIQSLLVEEELEHYMGYLVLQTVNNKEFHIIDGQQRLTTMSLLILATLKCLKDLSEAGVDADNNLKRKDNLLNSYIGYIDPVTLISNNKLKLNRNSNNYYKQHLVLLKDLPIRSINASERHMRDCFNWFFERIKKSFKTGEELAQFIDSIVDKLFFTVIEVSDQINAFKVFETLNARGVQLSSSDLLKNYFFSVVDETQAHDSEIEELETIWSIIVGKLGEQKFEDYLRYYWNSEHKSVSKKNLFKAIKSGVVSKEQVFALLRSLNDTVDFYLAIQNPEDDFWRDKPGIKQFIKELKLFQIKQTHSLFLSALKNLTLDKVEKLAKVCSVISFRYNVIGGLNPNAQEEVYNSIALSIHKQGSFDLASFAPIYVSDFAFENDFFFKEFTSTTRNHKIVKYIFSKLELFSTRNEIHPESDSYTIEHILPENPDASWNMFTDEAIKRAVYRLGNLTLLEKKLNRDAGNLSYPEKSQLFLQSSVALSKEIPENYETWTEEKIAARQNDLAKIAKRVWRVEGL
jgi:uncharacterized protein with ParB-like and HNH nuclease domain